VKVDVTKFGLYKAHSVFICSPSAKKHD